MGKIQPIWHSSPFYAFLLLVIASKLLLLLTFQIVFLRPVESRTFHRFLFLFQIRLISYILTRTRYVTFLVLIH